MKQGKKQPTQKLNQNQVKKKIETELNKRYTHLVARKDAIEFILPEENHLNRMMFHNHQLAPVSSEGKIVQGGTLGQVKYFYLPKERLESINKLFNEIDIPEELHADLIGAYVNMFFAHCTATYSTDFSASFNDSLEQLHDALSFLKNLLNDNYKLLSVEFNFQDNLADVTKEGDDRLPSKAKKFTSKLAVGTIEDVLKNYQQLKEFEMLNTMTQSFKPRTKEDSFMGHQNAEKQSQSYYAWAIFEYLNKRLFNSALDYYGTPQFKIQMGKLKRKYSRRKRFTLIGKLMELSELLPKSENRDEEALIDNIEKKLLPYMNSTKRRLKKIEEHNKNPTDGRIEIVQFGDLF